MTAGYVSNFKINIILAFCKGDDVVGQSIVNIGEICLFLEWCFFVRSSSDDELAPEILLFVLI